MDADRMEQLADVLFESVRVFLEAKVGPIMARLETLERSFLPKGEALTLFAQPAEINARFVLEVAPLRESIVELSNSLSSKPGLDLIRAEQATIASKTASELFATLRLPEDGKSVAPEDLRPMLEQMVAAIPKPDNGKDALPVDYDRLGVMMKELVAAIPKPKDGTSVDIAALQASINAEVAHAVAAMPVAKDGKDVDPADVRTMIVVEVARQVDAIPKPKDGHNGTSVSIDELRPLVAMAVEAEVGKAVAAMPRAVDGKSVTIEDVRPIIAEAVAAIRIPEDGKSVTLEDVRPVIAQAVAAIPVPKDGVSVDASVVKEMVAGEVARAVAAIPAPKDGASVDVAEVKAMVAAEVSHAVAVIPKPEDGKDADFAMVKDMVQMSVDAAMSKVRVPDDGQPGKDADPIDMAEVDHLIERRVFDALAQWPRPKDGTDGLGFDDMSMDLKEDGRTMIWRYAREGREKVFEIVSPWQIYKGVYTSGKEYQRGDVVSYAGSMFVATRDTTDAPGEKGTGGGWLLAVKRGKDAA